MKQEEVSIRPGVYQHYKGKYYLVLFVVRHSETEELFVCYRPLYKVPGVGWTVRPYDIFTDRVTSDGKEQPRFRYIGDAMP